MLWAHRKMLARLPARFEERSLVLVLADLAGFTRAVAHLPVVAIAEVVDRFYSLCGELVAAHGGRVVKFSGDNCLAVFDPVAAPDGGRVCRSGARRGAVDGTRLAA